MDQVLFYCPSLRQSSLKLIDGVMIATRMYRTGWVVYAKPPVLIRPIVMC
jgi:hypothetical protein